MPNINDTLFQLIGIILGTLCVLLGLLLLPLIIAMICALVRFVFFTEEEDKET
jgi:hypothetical protein